MLFEEISVERLGAIRYKEGREDGIEEGIEKGREKGIEKGKEEVRKEVFELMAQGLSVEEIKSRLTQTTSSGMKSE
ncbi:MAG: hypothetical protein FWD40_08975 [Treponema sp.]|nr:hypothetical protein [Treponema sp.]